MLDDEHRGYLLELMVTKLLLLQQNIQIIGMSATLSVCSRSRSIYLLTNLEHGDAGGVDGCQVLHLHVSTSPN